MNMTTLEIGSLYKGSVYGDVLRSTWVFIWKKYADNILLCLFHQTVLSRQTRHMFITT